MDGLLVIDVQQGMFSLPGAAPHDGEATLARICGLVDQARDAGAPVLFVLHDGGPGDPLEAGGPGFLPPPELALRRGDRVTIKGDCDAFQGTDLEQAIRDAGVDRLIVCGLQTELCVGAAVRAAVERGYEVVLVEDGHTTFDTPEAAAAEIIARQNRDVRAGAGAVAPAAAIQFG